jgi:ATP-binding cassette, subfamily B, bacterial
MTGGLATLRAPSILGLLRPHWKAMTLALVGVAGEAAASLLEPWPLKIVLDYLLQARPLPGWMMPLVEWIGSGKLAVLNVAVLAVAVIAIAGAASGYLNAHLTSSVGQRVMHDLRRTLYHNIHRCRSLNTMRSAPATSSAGSHATSTAFRTSSPRRSSAS